MTSAAPPARRAERTSAVALCLLPLLAACGGEAGSAGTGREQVSATPEPSSSAAVSQATPSAAAPFAVRITADSVTPSGDRVEVRRGASVRLRITADTAGELHVHSSPEKELDYPAGTSTVSLAFDRPGVVEVEDHELDALILRLVVR